jgi:acyl carrier protein
MPLEREEIERLLERFIVDELLEERYDGRDPLAAEAVDSLGLEQLVGYIEEELGVGLADEEVVRENFAAIPALAAFIASKQGRATA